MSCSWLVPCNIINLLAPTLTFGSRNFTVSPSTFNLGPVSEGSTDCIAGLAGGGSGLYPSPPTIQIFADALS